MNLNQYKLNKNVSDHYGDNNKNNKNDDGNTIITMIIIVIINSLFQPGDFFVGSTTGNYIRKSDQV